MKKTTISIAALLMAASMALAGALDQFKAGDISVSLLDKDGATPLQAASVKALDAESGAVAAEAVSDDLGQAILALDAGRYVMNVNDINLAVFNVGADEGLSLARVIMPDAALMVAGQDESNGEESGAAVGTWGTWIWPVIGGLAAVGILVGAGFIIDNNTGGNGGGGDSTTEATTPPVTYTTGNNSSRASSR